MIVVGAGVFGASLARRCAMTGWEVTLVERIAPGHVRAGSGGESRLIRCAHGEDEWHARLARRGVGLWRGRGRGRAGGGGGARGAGGGALALGARPRPGAARWGGGGVFRGAPGRRGGA